MSDLELNATTADRGRKEVYSAKRRWLLGIAGTVALGAVGSGLWDVMLKPSFWWLGRWLLTIVTLGLSSVKDGIYRDVAKGHHELPSLYILLIAITVLTSFPFLAAAGLRLALVIVSRLDAKPSERRSILRRRVLMVLVLTQSLLGSIIFVRFLMLNYVNLAVTHSSRASQSAGRTLTPRTRTKFYRASPKSKQELITTPFCLHSIE